MTIQDLVDNQHVKIEINWGSQTYRIDSTVVGHHGENILLKPYVFHGNEIRVHENARNFVFNIYTMDPVTNHRVGWNDVELKSVDYKGVHYYICKSKTYLLYAQDQERRGDLRMRINLPGAVTDLESGLRTNVRVMDVSSRGIAFRASVSKEISKINIKVAFSDMIEDQEFDLDLPARIVRIVPNEDDVLYGCQLRSTSEDLLLYMFLRQSAERK
jgi:YHS domain-containing protein